MQREWQQRERDAAKAIADFVVEALSHVERRALADGDDQAKVREQLGEAFRDSQRQFETRARQVVEHIYRHDGVQRDDPVLEVLREDLFAETAWRAFGLSRMQLAKYGALWGMVLGGGIDLAVGGLSMFTGAAIGAVAGGTAFFFGGQKIARISSQSSPLARSLWPGDTGRFEVMGPVSSPRYAWVLLDRALVHCRAVRDRSHARRDALAIEGQAGLVASLPAELRDPLDKAMRDVLAGAQKGRVEAAARTALEAALASALRATG